MIFASGRSFMRTNPECPTTQMAMSNLPKHRGIIPTSSASSPHSRVAQHSFTLSCPQLKSKSSPKKCVKPPTRENCPCLLASTGALCFLKSKYTLDDKIVFVLFVLVFVFVDRIPKCANVISVITALCWRLWRVYQQWRPLYGPD